jgi:hypothetical protein
MTFQPGQSGNPAGKKPGTKNRKTLLLQELEKDGSSLANAIKSAAMSGDSAAMALWLSRLEPPARKHGEHVEFEFDQRQLLRRTSKRYLLPSLRVNCLSRLAA